jgi:hypothetical protein
MDLYQNFPNTLARAVELELDPPSSIPTPSWIATLTGLIGAESYIWGQG